MQDERRCSRCAGAMRIGFFEDKSERGMGSGASVGLSWLEGPLKKGIFGGARVAGKNRHDVKAYRCGQCGHLDLYVD